MLSLLCKLPLLEECRESVYIEHLVGTMFIHGHLSVSVQEFLIQSCLSARPCRVAVSLFEIDSLIHAISRHDVIQSQRLILKVVFKLLCLHRQSHHQGEGCSQ